MRAWRWCLAFFEYDRPQSMTRLLALLCVLLAAIVVWKDVTAWQTVGALVGGGAVALLTRTKVAEPSDHTPSEDRHDASHPN